jgi:hypothetical protein
MSFASVSMEHKNESALHSSKSTINKETKTKKIQIVITWVEILPKTFFYIIFG